MTLASGEIAQIVWAETKALGFGKADGSGDINNVRRLVAQLAASTDGAGFGKRESIPSLIDPRYGDTARALMSISDTAASSTPPQSRMIFWASGDDTTRPSSKSGPQPPAPWPTIPAEGMSYHGRFQLTDGRALDIFSRAPVDGDANDPVFVNALTGTGVKGGKVMLTQSSRPQAKPKVGYRLFVISVLTFILAAAWAYGLGVASRLTVQQFAKDANCGVEITDSNFFAGPNRWRFSGGKPTDCHTAYAQQQQKVADRSTIEKTSLDRFASWALSVGGSTGWTVSLFWPQVVGLLALTLLFVAAGYGINGRPMGAIIDGRYRMSLTLAQFALWSIVILGGWLVAGLFNVGFGGSVFGALSQAAVGRPKDDTLSLAVAVYTLIPTIPRELMAVLGISAASPFIARLITNTALVGSTDEQRETKKAESGAIVGAIMKTNTDPSEAALTDMVMNETEGENLVDPTRVQYAAMTGILVVSYIVLLFDSFSNIGPTRTLLAASNPVAVINSLPAIDSTFIALLFVSHAALWGAKIYEKKTATESTAPH